MDAEGKEALCYTVGIEQRGTFTLLGRLHTQITLWYPIPFTRCVFKPYTQTYTYTPFKNKHEFIRLEGENPLDHEWIPMRILPTLLVYCATHDSAVQESG